MFVSCVHPVEVLNAAFCMTFRLLMLVKDARGDHIEEAYSRASLVTALWVVMSVPFYLPLIMCYKHYSIGSCIIIFGTLSEQIYQLTFNHFMFYVLIYIYVSIVL